MKIAILDSITLGESPDFTKLRNLKNIELEIFKNIDNREMLKSIYDVDIIIVNKIVIDKNIIDEFKNLKYICLTATGYDNVDVEYANSKGILVSNVSKYSTNSVVQHTLAMAFNMLNNINYYDDYVKRGEYSKSKIFTNIDKKFSELSSLTWGIIGFGDIGIRLSEILKVLGTNIIYYDIMKKDIDFEKVDLEELLKRSDIVSIHTPLNKETKNLISKDEIEIMKKTGILINVARGNIVDEDALVKGLNSNRIAGACIDVFEKEPISKDSPFNNVIDKNKLILTPHIAWSSREAVTKLINQVTKNIESFMEGNPENVVGKK